MVSLGCPKNLIDTELMLGQLDDKYIITASKEDADIIIVNTCGFINDAKEESVNTILEMAQYKNSNCELLLVTGCLAQRYNSEIIDLIPEVDAVIGTGNFLEISEIIEKAYASPGKVYCDGFGVYEYDVEKRMLTGNERYAYLKIAEGCSNFCTYCIIPSLRGPYKSRKEEDILKEAEVLVSKGIREIIIIAQDTTRYGIDIYGRSALKDLLSKLSRIKDLFWIRLLYCYPELIDDDLIDEIANNEKIVKYLDIPLQHSSNTVLKRMGRYTSKEDMYILLEKLKKKIPDITIRTTFITGFPGETEEDFNDLCQFVKDNRFERMGVFSYSKEDGTPAAKLKPQIRADIKGKRHSTLMAIQKDIMMELNREKLGTVFDVMVSSVADDGIFYVGRSGAQAPQIDNLIYFTSEEPLNTGDIVKVKILNVDDYDLIGAVEKSITHD